MNNNYKLYLHKAPNGKRYYGITKTDPKKRWSKGKGYKNNQHFFRAINKYGWDNIKHEVIFDDLTESEAKELEQYMIQWYNTANRDYGYNISLGGEGCNGICGENHYWYGKHHSEETKKKISEANFGKQRTEEWKQKHSELMRGENHPNYGNCHSEETKQKISEAMKGKYCGKNNPRSKSVICLTTKRIFHTTQEGAEYYNMSKAHIGSCCKGKLKSAGKHNGQKLVWKYINYKHNKKFRTSQK